MNIKFMKSGFVTLVGRPNAGKSSLTNLLSGKKVSGVSPKPQTTQKQIKGIININDDQIVLLDTPGLYSSNRKSHINLTNVVRKSLEDVDLIIVVSDLTRDFGGDEDMKVLEMIRDSSKKVFVVFTKVDLVKKDLDIIANERIAIIEDRLGSNFIDSFLVSNKDGFGKDILLRAILKHLPEGEHFYQDTVISKQDVIDKTFEFINEACFLNLDAEIPYSLKYDVGNVEIDERLIHVDCDIIYTRDSQKPILLGTGGFTLSQIGRTARKSLEDFFQTRIYLDLKLKKYDSDKPNS